MKLRYYFLSFENFLQFPTDDLAILPQKTGFWEVLFHIEKWRILYEQRHDSAEKKPVEKGFDKIYCNPKEGKSQQDI